MTSAQIGKTLIMTFVIGYYADQDPANMLLVFPTLDAAKGFSKEKLTPFLRETPCLAEITSESRSRDSDDTLLTKSFQTGAHLAIAGANSPTSLASRSRRILLCDEVDKYEASAGTEGDPVNLAKKRLRTYWNKKAILASTPNIAGQSRIESAFEATDKRFFYVPCPYCEAEQVLKWSQFRYVEGPKRVDNEGKEHRIAERAWVECQACQKEWTGSDRLRAVRKGRWIATNPEITTRAGFHIWAGYSAFVTEVELASEWLDAQGKPEELKTFVNANLGETWREKGDVPDWKKIFDRRNESGYEQRSVPEGVLFLTAGFDVQRDWIEGYVYGWGRRKQCWVIDHIRIEGDTKRPEVWRSLDMFVGSVYTHVSGVDMVIRKLAIDSGDGVTTDVVYDWARRHRSSSIAVIKGGPATMTAIVGTPTAVETSVNGQKLDTGVKVQLVNVSHFKGELYGRLRLNSPNLEKGEEFPENYFHLCPLDDTEEFCKQLTAEQLVTHRTRTGYDKREWEKIRARNEALDAWVYARAAANMVGMDRMQEQHWRQLESDLGVKVMQATVAAPGNDVAPPVFAAPPRRVQRQVSRSSWMG